MEFGWVPRTSFVFIHALECLLYPSAVTCFEEKDTLEGWRTLLNLAEHVCETLLVEVLVIFHNRKHQTLSDNNVSSAWLAKFKAVIDPISVPVPYPSLEGSYQACGSSIIHQWRQPARSATVLRPIRPRPLEDSTSWTVGA